MQRLIVGALVSTILIISCSDEGTWEQRKIPPPPRPAGTLVYGGYDSTGLSIVQGWMTIVIQDSLHVTGEWHFFKIDDPKNIGPQVGNGQHSGSFYGDVLWLNTNPNYVDNNAFLVGQYTGSAFSGNWHFSTVAGLTNQGTFQATRQ